MKRKSAALSLMLLMLAAVILFPAAASAGNPFASPRGSCNSIQGTTVIITIFVDDPYHHWDFNRSEDVASYFRIHTRLGTACTWLTGQVARYGAKAEIYWDWHNLKHLYYWYTSSHNMRDYQYTYTELQEFIHDNIQLQTIKDYYKADNAIFMALYNQDINETSRGVSYPWDFSPSAGHEAAYELLWIMDEDNGMTVSAAGLAHEIMHCCGAVDLYEGSGKTTQDYARHLKKIKSNDIMFHIDYSDPEHIGESFSDTDAYFMGLLNSCRDKNTYGLPGNSFGH